MATFTFTLQGSSGTTIDASDTLQFAGAGGFDSKVTVGEYNDTTHVKTSGSADKSSGNTPNNNKFISQTGGTSGDSQADWGDGTEDIDAILDAECALLINFSDASSVSTESAIFYAYDGTTTTTGPTGVTFVAAESGDTNFTGAEGSGSALSLADQGASTSHDFYIVVSASPDSVGLKSNFTNRIELTYS
ncbi:MAG: hypothetical protein Tp172MES00d2C118482111_44 [Prokaryotic dsDNA virus sp.]|nr:MAG: hypothetical protein Tp172MES00d2C118482111_44 [Prokaryotic dsDNA virus sp.]|tara:strand:- start:4718 stop:5287 length:570 start_codon:yes stop_codon:yes gene_type:complete